MSNNPRPAPATVIRNAIRAALRQVRVALPGEIVAYDASKCQADVQPLVQEAQPQPDGSTAVERLPVVTHVPVLFVGGGGSRLTFPVAVGDTCLLLFASSSIDRWLALGGEVDPQDDRRHHLSDGIAIVGLSDFAHASAASGSATVLEGSDVRLGDSSASDAASRLALRSTMDEFMSVLNTVADSAGACAALYAALQTANWPAGFVASKVGAK